MATSQDTQELRALALAWMWSRPSSLEAGDAVDLETLDQWRQGLLSPEHSDHVKRQLADDPRLMRMLEELVAADDLVQQWALEEEAAAPGPAVLSLLRVEELVAADDPVQHRAAEEEAAAPGSGVLARLRELFSEVLSRPFLGGPVVAAASGLAAAPGPSVWARLRDLVGEALSRLLKPRWAGGMVAAAASVVLVVMLVPGLIAPELDRELDRLYAELDAPAEDLTLPWGPKIAMRGARRTEPDTAAASSQRLAKRAFQAGMVEKMAQLSNRYPRSNLKPGDRLDSELPTCDPGGRACRQQADLARTTGSWALAVYLQCQGTPAADQAKAIDLLPRLNAAWRELPAGHPLGDQVNSIAADQYPCEAVERLLRAWGRS